MIRTLFLASRPLSWVNTAFPFAAAFLLTTGLIDPVLVVGTLYFLIPYNLLMYGVNDVFDYESDLRNPRKGGAQGAVLDPRMHRPVLIAAIVTGIPLLLYLVLAGLILRGPAGGLLVAVVLAAVVFAVLAYSVPGLRFKERPFLDSATSSIHFVGPAVVGLVLGGATFTPGLWWVLGAFFAWGVASHAFGAVQDVVADRAAGIRSIATVLGPRATVRFAVVAYLLAGVMLLGADWPGPLGAVLVLPYVVSILPWWNVDDDSAESANRGWRRFLWLNYLCGFFATMLLIWWSLVR